MRALAALALFVASSALAQEQRGQGWLLTMAQAKVPGTDLLAYVEFQPRFTFAPSANAKVDQVLLRGAIGWQVHPRFSIWVGAAEVAVAGESRWFEQLTWNYTVGSVKFLVRTRFEQRWLLGDDGPATVGPKLRVRVQPRVQWTFSGPFLLIASDEVFVNLTPAGFDQNRAYVALGYRPHPLWLLELGYLHQLNSKISGHTPMLTIGAGF